MLYLSNQVLLLSSVKIVLLRVLYEIFCTLVSQSKLFFYEYNVGNKELKIIKRH